LGRGDFVDQLLLHAESSRFTKKMSLAKIVESVCGKLALSLLELTSQTRAPRIANARSIICHVAFSCGHRGVDIAHRLGITGSGVTMAAQRGKHVISEHLDFLAMLGGEVG
jgi:hypothetical protein